MSSKERVPVSKVFRPIVEELASTTLTTMPSIKDTIPGLVIATADVLRHRLKGTPDARRANARLTKKESAKRFIVAPRAGQQASGPKVTESLRQIHDQLGETIVRSEHETGPKVLRITPTEALLLKERYSNLLVEEDAQFRLASFPSPLIPQISTPGSLAAASTKKIVVTITSGGFPVPNASVVLLLRKDQDRGYEGTTDKNGRATVAIRSSDKSFGKVIVVPSGAHWSKVVYGVPAQSFNLDVTAVTVNGFDWGHVACDAASNGGVTGKNVKVAVIDSGIGPHPSLRVADGKSWVGGTWEDGSERHGTHCAGVIAALAAGASTWGYAPDIELYSLRVFGGADGGGYASDIGDAVEWATTQLGCDIISMSFVHDQTVGYLRQKIEKAMSEGVLCVAAAGNEGAGVRFPASLQDVVGVSAIGKKSVYPADSIHADAESAIERGDYYFAKFSNYGPEVDFCAPGVAITSTVPGSDFFPWDGTSMACPHVAGIAAIALGKNAALRNLPRDANRFPILIDALRNASADLGFPQEYQGVGLPLVRKL
jgi:subtilisin